MVVHASLQGLRVVVTRLQQQGEAWCAQLQKLGAQSVLLPVLELVPVASDAQQQAVKDIVIDFDRYQKAIFVSRNAVDFALQWLETYWPQLPQGVHYFAVGETTARQLQSYGLTVSALTAASDGAMNSESLLAAPELQQVAGEKIVIFRGSTGRGHMGEILRARGAQVTYCELYERKLPKLAEQQFSEVFEPVNNGPKTQVIALHSGESLQHLLQLSAQHNESQGRDLKTSVNLLHIPVLVPGERVAELARSAGFATVIVAENATDSAMTAALVSHHLFNLTARENHCD